MAYREYIDKHMVQLLNTFPADLHGLFEIGINHEQQHQELLLTDIKYILGHNPLFPPYQNEFKETISPETEHDYVMLPAGRYTIGHNCDGFSFDNEHAQHEVYLPAFSIRKSLMTNGEYLAFMKAGGYTTSQYWHSDGWAWVKENKIDSPLYWHPENESWCRYALSGLVPINEQEPVTHISYYEAAAFAEWSGERLPTEFEWEAASDTFRWGQRWEHTNSAYLAYPGYIRPPGAIGEYNGKFMINQMVLRGASVATPIDHSRKTYRNFFHPQLRWQFNGIRLCKK